MDGRGFKFKHLFLFIFVVVVVKVQREREREREREGGREDLQYMTKLPLRVASQSYMTRFKRKLTV